MLKEFNNYVHSKLEEEKHVTALVIDYEKCFDTLDHEILLEKLEKYGITDEALEWFRERIKGRKTTVKIRNEYSKKRDMKRGVPQGSLLSPYLFLLYANELPEVLDTEVFMFADDTLIATAHYNPEKAMKQLQTEMNKLQIWAHENKIVINKNKTKLIHIIIIIFITALSVRVAVVIPIRSCSSSYKQNSG